MTKASKNLYAKFRIDSSSNIMDAFIVSEDEDRVDIWDGSNKDNNESEFYPDPTVNNDKFTSLFRRFEHSVSEFQTTVPFIMRMMPTLLRFFDDREIRGFVQRSGDKLEAGAFEKYRTSIDHIGEVNRRIQYSTAIRRGVYSLPSMFLVGLISTYDVFLSDLIRIISLIPLRPGAQNVVAARACSC
jgi:hypothetical protein